MNEELKMKAVRLGEELRMILEENLLKDPRLTDAPIKRVIEIRNEIQQMGFLVVWKAKLDSATLGVSVDATLYEPKRNLSPDEQKIYDEWFARVNKFQPP